MLKYHTKVRISKFPIKEELTNLSEKNVTDSDEERKTIHEARVDFVKRLFAVSVSVGFASRISDLFKRLPDAKSHQIDIMLVGLENWRVLLLLFASLVAIIGSWEGYLKTVARYKLEDFYRFILDILLTFLYLLLLLSGEYYNLWFSLVPIIFIVYILWDIALMRTPVYQNEPTRPLHEQRLLMTTVWTVFFLILFYFKNTNSNTGFILSVVMVIYGLVIYRNNSVRRSRWAIKLSSLFIPLAAVCWILHIKLLLI